MVVLRNCRYLRGVALCDCYSRYQLLLPSEPGKSYGIPWHFSVPGGSGSYRLLVELPATRPLRTNEILGYSLAFLDSWGEWILQTATRATSYSSPQNQ